MQRCCPLLSTCLGVSEETVVAGQQRELTYREGRSGAELCLGPQGDKTGAPKTRSLHQDLQASRSTHHHHTPNLLCPKPLQTHYTATSSLWPFCSCVPDQACPPPAHASA